MHARASTWLQLLWGVCPLGFGQEVRVGPVARDGLDGGGAGPEEWGGELGSRGSCAIGLLAMAVGRCGVKGEQALADGLGLVHVGC